MTKAIIRLGRRYQGETQEEIGADLLRYDSEMRLAPWAPSIPLLIDHREGARIGTVTSLDTLEHEGEKWLTATADLYPDATWIERGTPASFKCALIQQSTFNPAWIYGGLVTEVSLLRDERPAEPNAKVTLLYEEPVKARAPIEVFDPRDAAYVEQRRREGLLVRPGISQVLGVR